MKINFPKFLSSAKSLAEHLGFGKQGRVQTAIDNKFVEVTRQYCPYDTGALSESPKKNGSIGTGKIRYEGPNAENLYYGIAPSGKPYNYQHKMPYSWPYWARRAWANHKTEILEEGKKAAKRK